MTTTAQIVNLNAYRTAREAQPTASTRNSAPAPAPEQSCWIWAPVMMVPVFMAPMAAGLTERRTDG